MTSLSLLADTTVVTSVEINKPIEYKLVDIFESINFNNILGAQKNRLILWLRNINFFILITLC